MITDLKTHILTRLIKRVRKNNNNDDNNNIKNNNLRSLL